MLLYLGEKTRDKWAACVYESSARQTSSANRSVYYRRLIDGRQSNKPVAERPLRAANACSAADSIPSILFRPYLRLPRALSSFNFPSSPTNIAPAGPRDYSRCTVNAAGIDFDFALLRNGGKQTSAVEVAV